MSVTFSAPWGTSLRVASVGIVLFLFGILWLISLFAGQSLFSPPLANLLLFPLLVVAAAAPFMVRAYRLENGKLDIVRPFWVNSFRLDELESVEMDHNAMKKSIRIFGNGGLLSITGLHWNKKLGRYISYANDPARAVVLRFHDRVIVVSPDDPNRFEQLVAQHCSAK